jgi:regulatory protein
LALLKARALRHLGRYAASRRRVGAVLERRALREATALGIPCSEVTARIEAVLDWLEEQGLLDDKAFARGRLRSRIGRGMPVSRLRARLLQEVEPETVAGALQEVTEEVGDLDLAAAVGYARRRRLGPWCAAERDAERRRADFLKLARAGFAPAVARRVAEAADATDLEVCGPA